MVIAQVTIYLTVTVDKTRLRLVLKRRPGIAMLYEKKINMVTFLK